MNKLIISESSLSDWCPVSNSPIGPGELTVLVTDHLIDHVRDYIGEILPKLPVELVSIILDDASLFGDGLVGQWAKLSAFRFALPTTKSGRIVVPTTMFHDRVFLKGNVDTYDRKYDWGYCDDLSQGVAAIDEAQNGRDLEDFIVDDPDDDDDDDDLVTVEMSSSDDEVDEVEWNDYYMSEDEDDDELSAMSYQDSLSDDDDDDDDDEDDEDDADEDDEDDEDEDDEDDEESHREEYYASDTEYDDNSMDIDEDYPYDAEMAEDNLYDVEVGELENVGETFEWNLSAPGLRETIRMVTNEGTRKVTMRNGDVCTLIEERCVIVDGYGNEVGRLEENYDGTFSIGVWDGSIDV
jgi:hypothetical protein